MNKTIALIPGDGIGPEIVEQAVKVLNAIAKKFGHTFTYETVDMGGIAIDKWGEPLPKAMLEKCLASDSVLLGAVGGPQWDSMPGHLRPEKGLLALRSAMGLYCNLRPATLWPQLAAASPLKDISQGIDFVVVRELIGGIYFGSHTTELVEGQPVATDIMRYSESEIRRIGKIAFETARKRRKKVTSVDKANVLDTSRLWRKIMHELAQEYPDVEYSDMLVDNAAMQLVKAPHQFDVLVTENMFGDILSDEASMLTGSIGMIPSSSMGEGTCGLFEPIHGSAPDIAGKDLANPVGTILSAAMMLRYSFGMEQEATTIEQAVSTVLDKNFRTSDTMAEGCTQVSCSQMGDAIASACC